MLNEKEKRLVENEANMFLASFGGEKMIEKTKALDIASIARTSFGFDINLYEINGAQKYSDLKKDDVKGFLSINKPADFIEKMVCLLHIDDRKKMTDSMSERQIGLNQVLPREEMRFTMAHEMGHLALDGLLDKLYLSSIYPKTGLTTPSNIFFSDICFYSPEGQDKPKEEEKADYFAAYVLMPPIYLHKEIKAFEKYENHRLKVDSKGFRRKLVTYLANVFAVSERCAEKRLQELNYAIGA